MNFWKRMRRVLLWFLGCLVALLTLFLALTPLGRYLVRAAVAEAGILLDRQPIAPALTDEDLPQPLRRKLALVLDARAFARDSLGLNAGESFTQFTILRRDTLVLVLSAAPRDRLQQHTWWFPVVGRLPYKGFFNYEQGRAEARAMAARGFDVNLRPASAFSTLGWFNDPLLSTTLAADSIDLVDTVIHELTHNTFFAKGRASFNESFATFVGARGSERFFLSRGDTASANEADERWHDNKVLGQYWAKLYGELDSVFRANPDDREKRLLLRDSVYQAARREMLDSLAHELRGVPREYLERVRLDNASLLGRRVYATDLDEFDRMLGDEGGNLPALIRLIVRRDG